MSGSDTWRREALRTLSQPDAPALRSRGRVLVQRLVDVGAWVEDAGKPMALHAATLSGQEQDVESANWRSAGSGVSEK